MIDDALEEFRERGFYVVPSVYDPGERAAILDALGAAGVARKFGVRAVLADHPKLAATVFTPGLRRLIHGIDPLVTECVKSIYFDKPPAANWVVNWHQDLTVNLRERGAAPGYTNWRTTPARTVVQPDRPFLEAMFTVRIHLDDCTAANGALRVIEGSHTAGVIPIKEWTADRTGTERICAVPAGGALLMHPLLLHASRRTRNEAPRRVVHLEFASRSLAPGLAYGEAVTL